MLTQLLFVTSFVSSHAQGLMPVDNVTRTYRYDSVISVSKSKKELFTKAITWFHTRFPESTLHVDTAQYRLVGKGKFLRSVGGQIVDYMIVIDFKEGKYKYLVHEFVNNYVFSGANNQMVFHPDTQKPWKPFQREIDAHVKQLLQSLYTTLSHVEKDW